MKHSMMDEERYTSNTHFYDQSAGKAQTTNEGFLSCLKSWYCIIVIESLIIEYL